MFEKINERIDSWWSKKLIKKRNKEKLLESLILLSIALGMMLVGTVSFIDYTTRTSFLSFEFIWYSSGIIASAIIVYLTYRGLLGKDCAVELADKHLEYKN